MTEAMLLTTHFARMETVIKTKLRVLHIHGLDQASDRLVSIDTAWSVMGSTLSLLHLIRAWAQVSAFVSSEADAWSVKQSSADDYGFANKCFCVMIK